MAGWLRSMSLRSSVCSMLWSCTSTWKRGTSAGTLGWSEQAAEVQAACLPVLDALARVEQVGAADHVVELADAQLGHDLAHFFSDEEEVVHHVLRLA